MLVSAGDEVNPLCVHIYLPLPEPPSLPTPPPRSSWGTALSSYAAQGLPSSSHLTHGTARVSNALAIRPTLCLLPWVSMSITCICISAPALEMGRPESFL